MIRRTVAGHMNHRTAIFVQSEEEGTDREAQRSAATICECEFDVTRHYLILSSETFRGQSDLLFRQYAGQYLHA
jgi:hypothetical protein